MARLSPEQVAAARRDPRFRPRPPLDPKRRPSTPSEKLVDQLLRDMAGVAHHYEDLFFPTHYLRGREHGFCPDFRIEGGSGWEPQYWEVTEAKVCQLRVKRQKVADASAIHNIRVVLIDRYLLALLREQPNMVLTLLRAPIHEIKALREARILAAAA